MTKISFPGSDVIFIYVIPSKSTLIYLACAPKTVSEQTISLLSRVGQGMRSGDGPASGAASGACATELGAVSDFKDGG